MRLRARFTIANSAVVLAVLLATGTLQYVAERRQLVKAQAAAQEAATRALAKACEEALLEENDVAALNFLKAFRSTPALKAAAVAGANGTLRLHSDALDGKSQWQGLKLDDEGAKAAVAAGTIVRDEAGEGYLRVVRWTAPLAARGRHAGLLRLEFYGPTMDAAMREQLGSSARRFLLVAALCLAVGLLGAAWLAHRLVEPIQSLAYGARRYSEGQLKHRVPVAEQSELGELAEDLNRMAARLAEVDELKQRFFHQLTHDLRVPLAAIQGYVELLLSGKTGTISPEQREHLLQAEQGAQAVADFVDNVLDLARLEPADLRAGRKSAEAEGDCDLGGVARRAVELVQAQAERLGVRVEADFLEKPPRVRLPEQLARRVVLNLLGNALKFTPAGGRVTVTVRTTRNVAILEVKDTGCGIPADKLGRIFEEFYRVPETVPNLRGPAGVGIGLAICKVICESHGGSIAADSQLGRGARFTVALPIAQVPASAPARK